MLNGIAEHNNYPKDQIIVSHQDLGDMEWDGVQDLVIEQANLFGFETVIEKRVDKNGYQENLLEYAERRGKWPSRSQRWCTSDFKRGPGDKVLRRLANQREAKNVLYIFGFRADESTDRAKKKRLSQNHRLSTKKRKVWEFNIVLHWDLERVWRVIINNSLPYHWAYDIGMPRLSCVFCIFAPKDALVIAGKKNPKLLDRYIATEKKIGHTFKNGFAIAEVKKLINNGYEPKAIPNWGM